MKLGLVVVVGFDVLVVVMVSGFVVVSVNVMNL